jgi:hypothetical protein
MGRSEKVVVRWVVGLLAAAVVAPVVQRFAESRAQAQWDAQAAALAAERERQWRREKPRFLAAVESTTAEADWQRIVSELSTYYSVPDPDVKALLLRARTSQRKTVERRVQAQRARYTVELCGKLHSGTDTADDRAEYYRRGGTESNLWAVRSRVIRIGMVEFEVICAIGSPDDKNFTETPRTLREQWVYGEVGARRYVYFEDSKVIAQQF